MLASKLISIAAAIALAVPSTIALEQATHLRVQVHHHHKGPCSGPGESPMSVEGVEGVYCVSGQPCVAKINGACPGPQPGLEFGSSCGKVASGVQGCKVNKSAPKPEEEEEPVEEEETWEEEDASADLCTGEDESPMSVEGVKQIFCVTGQACVAHHKHGACPGPQEGLEWGSSCNKIKKTDVYGCTPNNGEGVVEAGEEEEEDEGEERVGEEGEEDDEEESGTLEDGEVEIEIDIETGNSCWSDETPISVQGVKQVFCVSGQVCVDDFKGGACPGPQEGLEWGSSCNKIKTNVYGCTPNKKGEEEASEEDETIVVIDNIDDMEGGDEEASSEEDDATKDQEETGEGEEEEEENSGEEEQDEAGEDAGEKDEGAVAEDAGTDASEEEEGSVAGDAAKDAGEEEGFVSGATEEDAGEEGEEAQGEEQTEGGEVDGETEGDEEETASTRHHHLRHKKVHHKKHHVKASNEDEAEQDEEEESVDSANDENEDKDNDNDNEDNEEEEEKENESEEENEEERVRHHHHKKN